MTTHTVGESSLSKRYIGKLWQIIQVTDKFHQIRYQQVLLPTPSSVLMLVIVTVPFGYMVMRDNVLQAVAVCGQHQQVFAEFSGKHGAQEATATVHVHVTDAIITVAHKAATIIVK